jgi:hypothetical protein
MRIGIFETDHFEGAYPVIRLFDNGENDITIFSYPQSHRQFQFLFANKLTRFRWIVKQENESKYRFIYRIYTAARRDQLELLYLNTITNNHLLYALMIRMLPKTRVVVTLHDINTYFHYKPSFSLRRLVRYLGKRALIKAVNDFNVVAETMVPYLQSKLPPHKKVHNIPGAVYETPPPPLAPPAGCNSIHIVVPGTIDGRRRNYQVVFDLLNRCNAAGLPVYIVLLGSNYGDYGKMILEQCRLYAQQHTNLLFYDTTVVDQPEFDRVMNNAHFVFTPSVINTVISDGITETYGVSISSGNLFDVIKHAKPFIIPAALQMPGNISSSCVYYDTVEDICALLQKVYHDTPFYEALAAKAAANSEQYTIGKVRERNANLFSRVRS